MASPALRAKRLPVPGALATLNLATLVLIAGAADAADFPVSGASLVLRRVHSGAETLSFVSTDPSLPFPAVGSPDDPSAVGALVEVIAVEDDSVGAFTVPPGASPTPGAPGWHASSPGRGTASHRYLNRSAPDAPSAVRTLALYHGRRLALTAKRIGLDFTAPLGAVAIRITVGARRICSLFTGASVLRDQPGYFRGRNAPASALEDCTDATLGTAVLLPCALR